MIPIPPSQVLFAETLIPKKMNEWARSQAEQLKKRMAEKASKDALFQERQKLRREQGRGQWGAVQEKISEQCDAFNNEMGRKVLKAFPTSSDQLKVTAHIDNEATYVEIEFKGETGPLDWRSEHGSEHGRYELRVNGDGKVEFGEFDTSPVRSSAEFIAQSIIAALLSHFK
jgi:hypothetical protein